ncbi:MAG: metalloregulator ArsR/SmtB family transcription factor [Thermoproteota archaeon]
MRQVGTNRRKKRNDLNMARAKIFKCLGDPLRLNILYCLKDGEKCVTEMIPLLKTVQPLISRHLKILKNCGLVSFRRERNRKPYRVVDNRIFEIIDMVGVDLVNSLSKIAEEEFS